MSIQATLLPLTWKAAERPVPVEKQFSSPVVARHMAEVARMNEELRLWRERRKGTRVTYKPIPLTFKVKP